MNEENDSKNKMVIEESNSETVEGPEKTAESNAMIIEKISQENQKINSLERVKGPEIRPYSSAHNPMDSEEEEECLPNRHVIKKIKGKENDQKGAQIDTSIPSETKANRQEMVLEQQAKVKGETNCQVDNVSTFLTKILIACRILLKKKKKCRKKMRAKTKPTSQNLRVSKKFRVFFQKTLKI
jgi:hypothetical protein